MLLGGSHAPVRRSWAKSNTAVWQGYLRYPLTTRSLLSHRGALMPGAELSSGLVPSWQSSPSPSGAMSAPCQRSCLCPPHDLHGHGAVHGLGGGRGRRFFCGTPTCSTAQAFEGSLRNSTAERWPPPSRPVHRHPLWRPALVSTLPLALASTGHGSAHAGHALAWASRIHAVRVARCGAVPDRATSAPQ